MAEKTDSEAPFRISGEQLIESTRNRRVIPLCLSADIGLAGGIPLGATVVIGGAPKCGKTSTSLQYGANAQRLYGSKVFYCSIEGRLTNKVMSQIRGLSIKEGDLEVILPPAIHDKKGKLLGFNHLSAEKWWNVIGELIIEHRRAVIIVDSIAQLISEKEISEEVGYQTRGLRQTIEASFSRKYGAKVIPHENTLFLLTHIQANTSGWGPTTTMKIGNSLKHQADVIMFAKGVEKWPEEKGRILGHDILYRVEENAFGPPYVDMKIPLRYGYGVDNLKDLVVNASNWDLITKNGSWYRLPFTESDDKVVYGKISEDGITVKNGEGEILGESVKVQGEPQARNWFLIHPNETAILENAVRNLVLGGVNANA